MRFIYEIPMKSDIDISALHTTPLGLDRIRRNLQLPGSADVVALCRGIVCDSTALIERKGKNWYITARQIKITVNAGSHTIITAKKSE